jgi:soluble lytic murein transglycosylase-like protein
MHHKRRLLIALLATGGISVGLTTFAATASAVPRTFVVTVVGNIHKTITVDVPASTPIDQIQLPSVLGLPILNITEITPAAPAAPAAPAVTVPGVTADPAAQAGEQIAGSGAAQAQRTTGNKKRVPRAGERALDSAGNVISGAVTKVQRTRPEKTKLRFPNGVPTLQNPTMSLALPGPVAVGVPNFFIDKFAIPVFLLPIYQAAGIQYGVPWEILAAINEIETNYGRNLSVSSAGAVGWMQFMPSSWKMYGVDANGDGKRDPFNPVDAVFAAARYLKAAGAQQDLRKAIFAYNHADWYVNSVLMRARFIGGMPADLVGSLSGLTQGRFPVYGTAKYADDISERNATRRIARGKNAALPIESTSRRGLNIFAKSGSRVIAVQDGTIVKVATARGLATSSCCATSTATPTRTPA